MIRDNRVFNEVDKLSKNQKIWLILSNKDNAVEGRITTRTTKNLVCHITFIFWARYSTIKRYDTYKGCGYNKLDAAMDEFIPDCIEELKRNGITFKNNDFGNYWKEEFVNNGYKVVQAI